MTTPKTAAMPTPPSLKAASEMLRDEGGHVDLQLAIKVGLLLDAEREAIAAKLTDMAEAESMAWQAAQPDSFESRYHSVREDAFLEGAAAIRARGTTP